jgi:hypothetical protein
MIESHHKDAKTTPRIILITPPPIREHLIFQYILHEVHLRSRENTFAYSQVVMNLTVPSFVEQVDLHDGIELAPAQAYLQKPTHYAETNTTNSIRFEDGGMVFSMEEYLSDGLHLKNPSYEIMYRLVMEVIGRRWPEIIPEEMAMPVPWWGNLVLDAGQRQGDEL